MGRVAEILAGKKPTVHTVDKRATVFEAVKKMVDANVGSLIVTDGDAIHGIITERDLITVAGVLFERHLRESS